MSYKTLIFCLSLVIFSCTQSDEKNSNVVINPNGNHQVSNLIVDENDIKTIKDSLKFDQQAIRLLIPLADSTGGKMYFSVKSQEIASLIAKVIKYNTTDSADIVLLIDKTGSMSDDIEEVKKSLNIIINEIRKFRNIQVSVAAYGDRWNEPTNWFDMMALTNDYTKVKNEIDKIEVTGGGDLEESIYDGLFEVFKKINWRSSTKRMILVIGDAPPLTGKLTKHSQKEIFTLCQTLDVKANLYPIIVNFGGNTDETIVVDSTVRVNNGTDTLLLNK
jgi:von Willebrand factor type A domain